MAKVLKDGSKGPDVKKLQELLNKQAKPSPKLAPDGDFGAQTGKAVKAYQRASRLKVDGVVGPATLQALSGKSGGGGAKAKGKVSGPTSGVDATLVAGLEAVAEHYGVSIVITSGKRDAASQARAMWNNWKSNLKEGALYTVLKKDAKLLQKLRTAYDEPDRKTFDAEIKKIAPKLSRHVAGGAVDLKKNTDAKAVKALASMFHHIAEKTCHHFDTKSKPAKIDEAVKARWPK